jgi:vancomycin resistance protein YoaR
MLPLQTADVPVVVPRLGFPFRLLVLLTLLPLLLAASGIAAYRHEFAERIYPGVRVLDVYVGRLTRDEAAAAIRRHLAERTRATFLVRHDDGAATVSLAALGVKVDDGQVADMADRALGVGRADHLRPWLRLQLDLLRAGHRVPASLGFDREQAAAVVGRIAVDVERPTVNASLAVEKAGDAFEIHTSSAQTGRRVNVNATLDRLEKALVNALPGSIELVVEEAPPAITDGDLVPAVETIQTILSSPLEFKDGARTWKLEPEAAHEMLEVTGFEAGRPPISAKLNDAKLREFVERVARAADQPARNPVLEVAGDQVVVRAGAPGKLANADATFEIAKERSVSPIRVLDIIFKADQPWLTPADLEPFRVQANALLDRPITLEAPPDTLGAGRTWVLDRPTLAALLALPNTQAAPREYQSLPVAQRPRFEIQLDSGKVTNYLAREVAPWVSEDPVDAELQLKSLQVELRNARDGRGPDYMSTFSAMQVLFRAGATTDAAERRVTVRLAARPPRVQDRDLAAARDMANRLVGEPVEVRWQDATWTLTRDELAGMLRYQSTREGVSAYLTRDGLLAKAAAIAREAERHANVPKDSKGKPLLVDVTATAASIWQQASTVASNRMASVVWTEEEPPA